MLKRLIREPLVHFLLLAGLIFVAYSAVQTRTGPSAGSIVISKAKIEQIAGLYAKTWKRPPTAVELKALIDAYIKEEIYYREAVELGLDQNDTVIRRRLQQKLQFLSGAETVLPTPDDSQLMAYLAKHADAYAIEPEFALTQIFFSEEARGEHAQADASAVLRSLRTQPDQDVAELGDPTMLPMLVPMSRRGAIAKTFGDQFADKLATIPTAEWTGPVRSTFGIHLVRINSSKPGRSAQLAEVRDAVLRDWTQNQRIMNEERMLNQLLKKYDISIESMDLDQAKASSAK